MADPPLDAQSARRVAGVWSAMRRYRASACYFLGLFLLVMAAAGASPFASLTVLGVGMVIYAGMLGLSQVS